MNPRKLVQYLSLDHFEVPNQIIQVSGRGHRQEELEQWSWSRLTGGVQGNHFSRSHTLGLWGEVSTTVRSSDYTGYCRGSPVRGTGTVELEPGEGTRLRQPQAHGHRSTAHTQPLALKPLTTQSRLGVRAYAYSMDLSDFRAMHNTHF